MDLLTNSRMKTARACLRLDQLTYVEGWRAVREEAALRFGSLFHAGLEAWWLATMAGLAGDERLDASLAALSGESDPFDHARADALLRGYDVRWGDERYEVLAVEHAFEVDLTNPDTGAASRTFRLAGKVDGIVRDMSGRTLLIEHKTSSEQIGPGSEYWRRLQIDSQISTYYAGARSMGFDVEGCLYDVIGKPGIKPLKATPIEDRKYVEPKSRACKECKKKAPATGPHVEDGIECVDGRIVTDPGGRLYANMRAEDETPDEFHARLVDDIAANPNKYYQRGVVVRLESEIAEAAADAWMTAQIVRDAVRTGRAPRNPDACSRWNRTCQFFDVCTGAASLDDASQFVKLASVHPELAQ